MILVGSLDWPLPIPVAADGKWYLGAAGAKEIAYRRIGSQ